MTSGSHNNSPNERGYDRHVYPMFILTDGMMILFTDRTLYAQTDVE